MQLILKKKINNNNNNYNNCLFKYNVNVNISWFNILVLKLFSKGTASWRNYTIHSSCLKLYSCMYIVYVYVC